MSLQKKINKEVLAAPQNPKNIISLEIPASYQMYFS